MIASPLTHKPAYDLVKQSDIVDFYHLQFPRWLIEDRRYMHMTLEAKFTYTLLFNRFQLSKHNGWMNEDGEVFVIYTRDELSVKMNAGVKRVTSAMNELRDFGLIWERRCGRGFANQIYLARVQISEKDAAESSGGPMDRGITGADTDERMEESRPAEMTGLAGENDSDCIGANDTGSDVSHDTDSIDCAVSSHLHPFASDTVIPTQSAFTDITMPIPPVIADVALPSQATTKSPSQPFKNCQNDDSRNVKTAIQETPNPPPSYKAFSYKDLNHLDSKVSQCHSLLIHQENNHSQLSEQTAPDKNPYPNDQADLTDKTALATIMKNISPEYFSDNEAAVIRDAVERLYYSQSIRIGNAVYPSARIREHLRRLDFETVQDTLHRLHNNRDAIKNSSAYTVTVLFNTIMESRSDLLLDPYLNHLRTQTQPPLAQGGEG